jgi:hypothetical protein
MIPKNITRQHVLSAVADIDRSGTPDRKVSRKFTVDYNGNHYPPKYLVSLANRHANGTELSSSVFNGGAETNDFLRSLGFTVSGISASGSAKVTVRQMPKASPQKSTTPRATPPAQTGATTTDSPAITGVGKAPHTGERCEDCKRVVKTLLEKIYGPVQQNYRLDLGTRPEDYASASCQAALSRIYSALQQHRGFKEFVGMKTLPPSDFFVVNPGFLVEFDESQHFTKLRDLALSLYPSDLYFGFDLVDWMLEYQEKRQRDNDPPYRDEQRAWYDTLRDFAPHATSLLPTLRLHANGFAWSDTRHEWCSLHPDNATDVETFRHILGEWASFWLLDYKIPDGAHLARIAIDGAWRGNRVLARKLLSDIGQNWPSGVHVHCLSTCGAFLVFDWPESVPQQQDNRFPNAEAVAMLDGVARKHVQTLLGGGLRQSLATCSNYLTIGVDSYKSQISSTDAHIPDNHAELVYVVNLKTGDTHFTGKSYPTPNQEGGLLRVLDLGSHFITLDGAPTMVLGCHDLTIFNPRSDATASGWRLRAKNDFKNFAKKQKPRWVLQHPHTTVNPMTWRHAWNGLLAELPSVTSYLGTGCYSYRDSKNGLNRKPLQAVLGGTKSLDVADIVVHLAASAAPDLA